MTAAPRYTLTAAVLSTLHQLGEALVPIVMGFAIDRAVAAGDPRELLIWLVILAADFMLLSFSYRFGSRIAQIGEQSVQHALRAEVIGRLLRGHDAAPGAAVSLAMSDVRRAAGATRILVFPVGEVTAVVFGGIVLLTLWWPVGLGVLVGAPVLLWVTDRLGTALHRRSQQEQDAAAAAASSAADLVEGYRVIRGLGAESVASGRYRSASRQALRATLAARRAEGGFVALADIATGLFVVAIAAVTAYAAATGVMSVGSFIAVVGLTQFLMSPLQQVARRAGTTWAAATASAARLLTVLHAQPSSPPDPAVTTSPLGPCATLEIDGLRVGNRTLTATMRPGDIMVLRAPVSRAAELGHVLAGHTQAAEGSISLDGEPITAHTESVLHPPHGAELFSGTVRENVLLPGVGHADAEMALAAASCEDIRDALDEGYDTPVGERGRRLSGGQRQRVALARAYAHRPALLILHDPSSAVDAVTESRIAQRLRGIRGSGYTILITRSPALAEIADQVIDLDAQTGAEDDA
jgi:ABC-type multidrug transport system fused ATPase/permease subunit